jgi:hypothetical protein
MKLEKIKATLKERIFTIIRTGLILSVIANILITLLLIYSDNNVTKEEVFSEVSKRTEFIFWGIVTLILTFGSTYIQKRNKINIPEILDIVIIIFIISGTFLSVRFNLYYRFFWWDDLLHTLSGVIIGFIGFIMIYKINHKYSMDISPLLVAVFSFTFAVTLGVFWEILEFVSDVVLGTANQKWNLPDTAILIGKSYQGSGLRDTMSDLIVNCIGAFITSVIAYFMYKNEKPRTLERMKKMIKNQ